MTKSFLCRFWRRVLSALKFPAHVAIDAFFFCFPYNPIEIEIRTPIGLYQRIAKSHLERRNEGIYTETLYFITQSGVCGHTEEWTASDIDMDSDDWLGKYGDRIGSGTARLPGGGWIDLRQFSTITKTR